MPEPIIARIRSNVDALTQELLPKLRQASTEVKSPQGGEGRSGSHPGSRPPGNMEAMFLSDEIWDDACETYSRLYFAVHACEPETGGGLFHLVEICTQAWSMGGRDDKVLEVDRAAFMWSHRVRVFLGHEKPDVKLRDVACEKCGGFLIAMEGVNIMCPNRKCGAVYAQSAWLGLLAGGVKFHV